MKCGNCVLSVESSVGNTDLVFCPKAQRWKQRIADCTCNAQRVSKLLEQLPEVGELMSATEVTLNDYYESCDNDMSYDGIKQLQAAIDKLKEATSGSDN